MNRIKLLKNSFKKDGGFGIINMAGLALGMAMSLLITGYLEYHFSFDSHIPERDKIYQLISRDKNDGSLSYGNPLPMAHAIQSDYPGVGEIAALSPAVPYPVTMGGIKYNIKASTTNNAVFSLLGMEFLTGSGKTALSDPGSAVLTKSCAQKLFGQADPAGQTFTLENYDGEKVFMVSGVVNDPPVNSGFEAEMYLSWETMNPPDWEKKWWWSGTNIFVKVMNESQKTDLEQKINTILDRHKADFINGRYDFQLISMKSTHFRTDIENPLTSPVSSRLLGILSLVAVFIIVIACINFINLAIGQSEKNTKGTGIHKVLGASGKNLALNFLIVTFHKALIASGIALILAKLLEESFQHLAQMKATSLFSDPVIWSIFCGMVILSGLLAGLYPALVISRPRPAALLSNRKDRGPGPGTFRKVVVVIQFSIATILIIAALFIFRQISFMKNHDLGFHKEGMVAMDISSLDHDQDVLQRKAAVLEQEISKGAAQNGILSMAAMEAIPGTPFRNGFTVFNPENRNAYTAISVGIDENYSGVLEAPVVEGRNFSGERASDREAILINETLKKQLGWNSVEDKQLAIFSQDYQVPVIGVFKDVNINSLDQAIPPMIFRYKENAYPQYLVFRIHQGDEAKAASWVRSQWKELAGDKPFSTFSVADRFNAMYGNEERLSKIIGAFCLVAVILSCFGLLAHMALSVQHRTKEIGIRKVNGAKVSEILAMLNKDFLKWIAIAFVIATPVAYYAMQKWLENFAYKTTLSWWIFALLTVSWQSWKAATRNPVEALRYE